MNNHEDESIVLPYLYPNIFGTAAIGIVFSDAPPEILAAAKRVNARSREVLMRDFYMLVDIDKISPAQRQLIEDAMSCRHEEQ